MFRWGTFRTIIHPQRTVTTPFVAICVRNIPLPGVRFGRFNLLQNIFGITQLKGLNLVLLIVILEYDNCCYIPVFFYIDSASNNRYTMGNVQECPKPALVSPMLNNTQ